MLNHLYRYTVRQELLEGPFRFPAEKPAAFFPGTFDPFSVGHKQIVQEIRARGFEVETGQFGAEMQVASVNDGPVTIILDTKEL